MSCVYRAVQRWWRDLLHVADGATRHADGLECRDPMRGWLARDGLLVAVGTRRVWCEV